MTKYLGEDDTPYEKRAHRLRERQRRASRRLAREWYFRAAGWWRSRKDDEQFAALVDERLNDLAAYRRSRGPEAQPHPFLETVPRFMRLSIWVRALRILNASESLSPAIVEKVESTGISLHRLGENKRIGKHLEAKRFLKNIRMITDWLDAEQAAGRPRDICYRTSRRDLAALRCYMAVQHALVKYRDGVLPEPMRMDIESIDFTIRGMSPSEAFAQALHRERGPARERHSRSDNPAGYAVPMAAAGA